ncbi:hypothetical protein LUR56_39525 [Streptomyces sp. MT29]|nr:hypothetical protein [Streptomyces sp. MT29]
MARAVLLVRPGGRGIAPEAVPEWWMTAPRVAAIERGARFRRARAPAYEVGRSLGHISALRVVALAFQYL